MTERTDPVDGLLRRTVLKAGAVAAGAFATASPVTVSAAEEEADDADTDIDEPDGFEVEILAEHAPFVDDVAATFDLAYADDDDGDETDPVVVELDDASTAIVAEATWEDGGRSGWHRHPGMSIVSMVEGEIEVTMEHDCVPRTYAAGDAWIDPGHVHKADSEDGAAAYVMFFGIPDGEPATEWVEPIDC